MKTALLIALVTLVGCDGTETGMSTGGGGEASTGSSSVGSSSGAGGASERECPANPSGCTIYQMVKGACLLVAAPTNYPCTIDERVPGVCNGIGLCSKASCSDDGDCGKSNACASVECVPAPNDSRVCEWSVVKDSVCGGVCAHASSGPPADTCGLLGKQGFYCDRPGGPPVGPPLGIGNCSQPDPANPETWCCD